MNNIETTALTFLTGSGTTLATILWFFYLQKKEKRDRLIQLNQTIYKEIDRLQMKLEMLEQQKEQYREKYYMVRESEIRKDETERGKT
jgi:hypothetical protein